MRVFLTTLGCRLNEAEVEQWTRSLNAAGAGVVGSAAVADVVVVNTCAVTTEAARKSRKLVAGLHRDNPGARIVLTGCFAELESERAAKLAGVDFVVGNEDKDRLGEILRERLSDVEFSPIGKDVDDTHVYQNSGRTRAFVKVQDGCRNRCAFCIVTVARGEERSRAIDEIVAEIADLASSGYREAVLTGVHLGGYGSDIGKHLFELVGRILADTDIPRLRLSSLEPWDIPTGFWRLWENPRLLPHLHLPLQSGSDTVLRRMARRSFTGDFRALVAAARSAIPDLNITTDIIAGFPGETESEWRETVDFVQHIGFGHIHIFSYSPRDGTKAARLAGQLDGKTKRARSRELHDVAADMKARFLSTYVGQIRDVLWEGKAEILADGKKRWWGYTDNYLRVSTETSALRNLENRVIAAELVAVDAGGGSLRSSIRGDRMRAA